MLWPTILLRNGTAMMQPQLSDGSAQQVGVSKQCDNWKPMQQSVPGIIYCYPMTQHAHQIVHLFHRFETYHQRNVLKLLGASRSVWEDVECKLRCINFGRVLEPRRALRPALGVTGISDDWYMSAMRVIVISFGTRQSTGENIECT